MDAGYDNENIFALVLRGELAVHKVYEDELTLAFMDATPRAEGHTLVIPKAPSRGLLDADPATLSKVIVVVQRVGRAVVRAFGAEGLTVLQCNERSGDQTVFHLHFHVVPRREGVPFDPRDGGAPDAAVLAEHAKRIRSVMDEA